MIFGIKHEDLPNPEDWTRRYAYLPVRLYDGRWIWREYYWHRCCTTPPDSPGVWFHPVHQRFLDVPPKRDYGPPPRPRM